VQDFHQAHVLVTQTLNDLMLSNLLPLTSLPAKLHSVPRSRELLVATGLYIVLPMHETESSVLTEGDAQVAWHHGKVDQLCWDPDGPQGFAVLPQLSTVLCINVLWGAALNKALHAVEHRKVEEGMAAGHGTYSRGISTHLTQGGAEYWGKRIACVFAKLNTMKV
jgi:hypothetical protein